ncbi:MAG: PolC-type DNA polymerase III [Candidatus Velthaea sp.]
MDARCIRHTTFAFVDVETTGIDAATARVVEVAYQIVRGGAVTATFESLIDPQCGIPPFATAIHGITDAHVHGKPTLAEVAPALVTDCDGAIVVAHNAAFDRRFLTPLAQRRWMCSWRLAARVVPEAPNHKNHTLGAFFGVRDPLLRGRRAHRALCDVVVTRHVFFHCIERYLGAGYGDCIEDLATFLERPRSECLAYGRKTA